jgi:hypothetical protein
MQSETGLLFDSYQACYCAPMVFSMRTNQMPCQACSRIIRLNPSHLYFFRPIFSWHSQFRFITAGSRPQRPVQSSKPGEARHSAIVRSRPAMIEPAIPARRGAASRRSALRPHLRRSLLPRSLVTPTRARRPHLHCR